MTNLERYRTLTQLYVSHKQILELLESSDPNLASKIIKLIMAKAKSEGKRLLYEKGRVPAKMLIEHLGVNLDEIYEHALKEKELGIG